ncbi:MAG: hypothetical protein Q9187_001993 [Circinaria calcarea]
MSTVTGHPTQTPHLNQKGSAGWSWPRLVKGEAIAPAITIPSARPKSIHSRKSSDDIINSDPNPQPLSPAHSEPDLAPLPAVLEKSTPQPTLLASSIHSSVTSEDDSKRIHRPNSVHQPEIVQSPSMASSIHGSIHGSIDKEPLQSSAFVHQPVYRNPSSTASSVHGPMQNLKESQTPHIPQTAQQPMIVRPPSVTSSRRGSMDGSIDGTRSVHIIQLMHRSSISKAPSILESLHEPGEMELPPLPESPYRPSITDFPQVVESESEIFDTSPPESRAAPKESLSTSAEKMDSPVVSPIPFEAPPPFPEAAVENQEKVQPEAETPPMLSKRVTSATLPPPRIMILRATEDDDVSDEPLARYPAQSGFESAHSASTNLSNRPVPYHGSNTESIDHLPETMRNAPSTSAQRVRKRKVFVRKTRAALLRKRVLIFLLGHELAYQTQPVLKMMATGDVGMEVDSASAVA